MIQVIFQTVVMFTDTIYESQLHPKLKVHHSLVVVVDLA